MKKTIFTLLVFATAFAMKGQEASDFGSKDVLIADFETTSTFLTDSLWLDEAKTQPVTVTSENVVNVDNPLPISNVSATCAQYTRPAGQWKTVYLRFPNNIIFNETPGLQLMVYPESGNGMPASTRVDFKLLNDKGEAVEIYGSKSGLNSDEWSLITFDTKRFKSDARYNTIAILFNPENDLAAGTKYYIDAIGFKAPADGAIIPATVFTETFGTAYSQAWQDGQLAGQTAGEKGLASIYASIGGFTSGIPFTWVDANGNNVELQARGYGMNTMYDSPSGGGRIAMDPNVPGTLVTGDINVTGYSGLNIGFALGTQLWWAYNPDIAGARPKVEISVDGGAFYEIYSNSTFLQATGNFGHFDWGDPAEYEDQLFRWVDYGVTNENGDPISPNRINIKISYKEGAAFWIDDLWLSGKYTPTSVKKVVKPSAEIYPNPAVDVVTVKGATQIEILDITGKSLIKVLGRETVNVASLKKGIYLLSVCVDGVNSTSKLVKK